MIHVLLLSLLVLCQAHASYGRCRSQPGDIRFPSQAEWAELDRGVDGRLVRVSPSALACHEQQCTTEQWTSSSFRVGLPGQMINYNWEQDFEAVPPDLCLHNSTKFCGQGNTPLFAINATTVEHIQAGVKFAAEHDLRLAVKSTGHDFLGRSTAKQSLLIWTHYLQNITFYEHYQISGQNYGSAVEVGSGVALNTLYAATEKEDKIFVGGTAATVAVGGGYIQGGGHSALSPRFGLASDNALSFTVVLANGEVATANEYENEDLFWALRGGGAGSWGVVVSVVLRTYPTFPGVMHLAVFTMRTTDVVAQATSAHARYIFVWDAIRAGQYYIITEDEEYGYRMVVATFFAFNSRSRLVRRFMQPFMAAMKAAGASIFMEEEVVAHTSMNKLLTRPDELGGFNAVLGSRLIPAAVYKEHPEDLGQAHKRLLDLGLYVEGCVVAGGKVAENAYIESAVNPKWRTARSHLIAATFWPDTFSADDVRVARERISTQAVPILANMTGEADSGSYTNEGDRLEPNFVTTFYGPNYPRLSKIKNKYDPEDLFIVSAGVGSERWTPDGMCTKTPEFFVQDNYL